MWFRRRLPILKESTRRKVIEKESARSLFGTRTFMLDGNEIVENDSKGVRRAVFDAETGQLLQFFDKYCGHFVWVKKT